MIEFKKLENPRCIGTQWETTSISLCLGDTSVMIRQLLDGGEVLWYKGDNRGVHRDYSDNSRAEIAFQAWLKSNE